jgi:enoyl-CoA hydratase
MNDQRYAHYEALTLKRHDHGILEIVMGAAQSPNKKLSTADDRMHRELSEIWLDIDKDPDTRVAIIRGEG